MPARWERPHAGCLGSLAREGTPVDAVRIAPRVVLFIAVGWLAADFVGPILLLAAVFVGLILVVGMVAVLVAVTVDPVGAGHGTPTSRPTPPGGSSKSRGSP